MSGRRADNRKKSQMKTSHFSFKITFEKREERRKLRIKIFFLLTFKSSWHRILRSRISFHVNFQRKKNEFQQKRINWGGVQIQSSHTPTSVTRSQGREHRHRSQESFLLASPHSGSGSDTDLQLEPQTRWCHSGAWPHSLNLVTSLFWVWAWAFLLSINQNF